MEYFLAIFIGGWIAVFGIFFLIAMNKEFAKFDVKGEEVKQ